MAGRAYRSSRLVAMLLAPIVFTAACQTTTGSGLRVRAEPTTASRIIGNLGSSGTAVVVECVIRGEAIYGNTTWYRISAPDTGYVTAYYVQMDAGDTAPAC